MNAKARRDAYIARMAEQQVEKHERIYALWKEWAAGSDLRAGRDLKTGASWDLHWFNTGLTECPVTVLILNEAKKLGLARHGNGPIIMVSADREGEGEAISALTSKKWRERRLSEFEGHSQAIIEPQAGRASIGAEPLTMASLSQATSEALKKLPMGPNLPKEIAAASPQRDFDFDIEHLLEFGVVRVREEDGH